MSWLAVVWGRKMEDVRGRYVSPAIDQLAFNCPHCGALAKQFWFSVHADRLKADEKPFLVTAATVEEMKHSELEPDKRAELVEWAEQLATGRPSLRVNSRHRNHDVRNISISSCSTATRYASGYMIS